jgi:muramoyltetrapeptide carboxypeptidase LdcA involved in peptidoglycan recycling
MNELQDFQTAEWLKAVSSDSYDLSASDVYTSDLWFDPTQPRHYLDNQWKVYHAGKARGTVIGGNIQTYGLQAGTEFLAKIEKPIAFLEEAEEDDYLEFDRLLAQFLQINSDLQALVIGRFPKESQMTEDLLHFILDKYPVLKAIPVIYDVDFGHTQPIFTFALGGECSVDTEKLELKMLKG